ncbi:uncharacterized protein CANTADRAFT_87761 [Suhomyces tanzawaensis NRRL Y-17324]|uniref:Uncharacterized protein n=1 Tax=Suhomyces tanzawaensis NRRL Y-17324 TaxID=984487 RepID=A0A1E4SQL0_9ASCO|nr:uncharacterized protein CANTADRAFT_87761 [Suhomyces tanzawaensis NRRL Y-17324]ODV81796.1 hypothetical protein CANTADRAFT_87761 [Suhomyces tanzawaensis NRRL Y-17324]
MPPKHCNVKSIRFKTHTAFLAAPHITAAPKRAVPPASSREQNRKANLGSTIEHIKTVVPELLTKSLPKELVSHEIMLRICPSHFDETYLPSLKGRVSYYATCKTMQLAMTSLVLSPKVKLHIQSLRVANGPDQQAVYAHSTKVYVRWSTCNEGCEHLSNESSEFHSTSDAKLGSHKWSKLDTLRFLHENADVNGHKSKTLPSISTMISQMSSSLVGFSKDSQKLERVLSGIFIFELNEENDAIIVHTIENVDLIEKGETEDVDGELRVC